MNTSDIEPRRPVAFLQNQWFANPARMRPLMEGPRREDLIRAALFMGCRTGHRLYRAFGEAWTRPREGIVWENVSREIGDKPSSVFAPDLSHVLEVIHRHAPGVVLLFGAIAAQVEPHLPKHIRIIKGPHPAARGARIPEELGRMADELNTVWGQLYAR